MSAGSVLTDFTYILVDFASILADSASVLLVLPV